MSDEKIELPDFKLTDRTGKVVTKNDLLGKPTIVAFTFSRCGGPCPRIMNRMQKLAGELDGKDVRLLTITVDPEYDKPEVLAKWAGEMKANDRWLFVGGDPEAVRKLVMGPFRQAIDGTGESLNHGTQLALVDKKGVIQKFYAPGEEEIAARAIELAPHPHAALAPPLETGLCTVAAFFALLSANALKRGRVGTHKLLLVLGVLAWAGYLGFYGWSWARFGHTETPATGNAKTFYLVLLGVHVVLAVLSAPFLAALPLARGDTYKSLVKKSLAVWLGAALSGSAVAFVLYYVQGAVP
ncbi:MAG: SCO family protein [Planctomycetota bacterium]